MKKNFVNINKVFLILGAFVLCIFLISYLFPVISQGVGVSTNQSSSSSSSSDTNLNNTSNSVSSNNTSYLNNNINSENSVNNNSSNNPVVNNNLASGQYLDVNSKAIIDDIMELQRLSYLFVYSNLEEKQLALSLDEYIEKSLTLIYSSYNIIDTNIIDISTKYVNVLMNELIIELKEDKLKNSFKFNNISSNDFLREKSYLDKQEDMLDIKEKQLKNQLKILIKSSGSFYDYSVFKNILDNIELD
ncbi:MAG: hypothetical protein KFW09_04550 [Oscillospiraceae bacterium]|nr:hypothetical protein [Oscillospiraceae bacterium]